MELQDCFNRNPSASLAKKAALSALALDAAKDITSERCIPRGANCSGKIIAKSDFVLCGLMEADAIFKSRRVKVNWKHSEGARMKKGAIVCTLTGNCRAILACERTTINYLMRMSGIATKSATAAKKYGSWKIAATRKISPGLTHSEKHAVQVGGCLTHRLDLSDGMLIKDNHIAAIMKVKKCGKEKAIYFAVKSFGKSSFVEIEISSVLQAIAAAWAGAKAILADNVTPAELKKIAKAARSINKRIIIEASGGITVENAGNYLRAGADFVSTSELTLDAPPANLSLEIE
ncbi:MAG: carboxylating nicotinate-nucleotide diphosphorylase [Candidatus Micrarchaeota archaeon]|nr:carboxylating nicotinate-nucleotide diphosphorylase [Candidatus Micrarchaeota archaeon]